MDLSKIVSFDISVTVADLEAPEGVEILTDAAVNIASVIAPRLRLEGEEEEAAEEEAGAAEGEDAAEGGEESPSGDE